MSLNDKSTTSNAVYDAICPQLLSVNSKAVTNWMALRYVGECISQDQNAEKVPCPFSEDATCRGEGCVFPGIVEMTKPAGLFSDPGSNVQIYTGKPGEFLIHETSVTYSVPCPARVQISDIPALRAGTTVHRLSYAGEGTYLLSTPIK